MDDPKAEVVRAWLAKAQEDLLAAEWLLMRPDSLPASVSFHAQQAAEKSLKAYLAWHEQPFGKTHSLVALVARCLALDPDFEMLRRSATILTPYAVDSRYPGDLPELSVAEAQEALALAEDVWEFVLIRLPGSSHPAITYPSVDW